MAMLQVSCATFIIARSDLHACVAWAGSRRHFAVEVVLDHDDFLAAVRVRLQHPLDRRVRALALSAGDVPPVEARTKKELETNVEVAGQR